MRDLSIYEDKAYDSALAIVGMAGRFPGASDVQTFWHNIAEGIVSIRSLSDEELLAAGVEQEQLADPNYIKIGAPLDGIDQFDAPFFGYTPHEAETMDPQHRLFLECCWQALEQAGYDPYTSRELIGVFAGSAFSSYFLQHLHPDRELIEQLGSLQVDAGNDRDSLASTVNYKLNLKGPAVTVQTFCSTSLVAVHLACQSLLNYESDLALGGGVALMLPHGQGYSYEEGSILSPDGVCRAFDAQAQGSVLGSGVGVVALKRLREALEEGDQIYAVVRGSAMNNDGSRRVSYTAPGLEGQANVIQAALSYAQVPAESISYIEAHGTGTKLGDAVELEAMRRVFEGKGQPAAQPYCALGSVKPNVGHLDRAAGVSGLIKTVQALRHHQLPPSVNYARPNPALEGSHAFYVNTQLREWEAGHTPRRAGVSSFGLGGTNVHLVLEEGPQQEKKQEDEEWQVLPLSARSPQALQAMRARLASHLREEAEEALGDVAYTLQVGRANFGYRSMVVCRERGEAIAQLEREQEKSEAVERRDRPVAWVLPGAGALQLADVRSWYEQEASFRQVIDRCADLLRATRGLDLRAFIFSQSNQASTPEWLAQIAFLATQYALACTLMHQGVQPGALYGSGNAEYIAACLSGVLSLEDALTLIVSQFERRPVAIPPASFHAPQIGSISALTGTWFAGEQAADPHYWEQERPVDASISMQAHALLREMGAIVLCIGASYEKSSTEAKDALSLLAELDAECSARKALLEMLGELWVRGVTIDWSVLSAGEQRLRVGLPTYPFEHKRYWIDSPEERRLKQRLAGRDASKKLALDDWFSISTWERQPLAAETSTTSARLPLAPVLLFMDESGLSTSLAARLTDERKTVIHVSPGPHYQCVDTNHYVIRPGERNDYLALCQDLQAAHCFPRTIIHTWGVGTIRDSSTLLDDAGFERAQEWGFYSLLWLAQALSKQVIEGTIHVDVIVSRALSLEAGDTFAPEKAPVLGISKVLSQEYPDIICRVIDIDQAQSPALIAHLLDELSTVSSETVVAYREDERWLQRYQRIQLAPEHPLPKRLRPRGTYLITGGLGAIGLIMAEYLVRTLQANVVLVSRSVLPERALWENWPEQHATTDKVSQQIKRVLALEASGGKILLVQADVARPAQLEAAFRQAEQQFGQIHGVIHAAGISSEETFKTIPYLERADCELHFQAKVYGLLALEQVVRERSLDFCLLFSSLATVLGGLSLAAYSAANLFLEAFAQQQNQQGQTPWLSVAWDTWQVREEATGVLGATVATYAMSAQEGVEAFTRVLSHQQHRHLVQSTGALEARLRQWVHLEGLRPEPGRGTVSRRVPRGRGEVEQAVQELWQEVLGLPAVGLYENYFDLGGNSLNGLQVMAQLRKLFQVQLPVVTLFEAPTIAALVERILAVTSEQPQDAEPASRAEQLRARRKQASQEHEREGIAIVAMTGRFPGARTVEQFWENLRAGRESISFFTSQELEAAGVPAEVFRQPNYVRARPILPEGVVSEFDAAFFGYSPREAQLLDPQHRLFLECCWEALERAGYDPQGAPEQIGVFGGTNISSYLHQLLRSTEIVEEMEGVVNGYQIAISMDKDSLTTAVSYKLNLRGPSLAVQTFCSTSLVAVHLACQSLRRGECDLALAGGVSVHVPVIEGHLYEEGGQESPDGHCRTFDARAGGSMFGDGVGVVVLKRLHEALEDGDQVLAVIRGSAINNDGAGKVSYTAPSVTGQSQVVLDALEDAGVSAESISYVEAHGTATKLGDPIEVAALTKAYRSQTEAVGYCAIGSVKTNVGHLDRAAGVSGLIKTVQALQAEELPASLHYERPNPEIDFARSPFVVNAALRSWPRQEGSPRRAGINSLGMGGTNVHVIVEEAPPREASGTSREWQLLLLSAKTATALEQATHQLGAYLEAHAELPLADVAYTLQVGRSALGYRRMLVCREREEAVKLLCAEGGKPLPVAQQEHRDREVAFLLPGVGEQYSGRAFARQAIELYRQEAVFRSWVDQACLLLMPYIGADLREVLFVVEQMTADERGNGHKLDLLTLLQDERYYQAAIEVATAQLQQVAFAEPATFILEYALVRLLMQWGLQPQALLGSGSGEYVAACLAGVLSLQDALMLLARRVQLLAEGTNLDLAAEEQLVDLARSISLHPPTIPYISQLTGTWISEAEATDAAYWGRHLCESTRLAEGVAHLLNDTTSILLEIGAGQGSLVRQDPAYQPDHTERVVTIFPEDAEQRDAGEMVLTALGMLWLRGVTPDWRGLYAGERRQRVLLPTYPFERKRYWLEPARHTTQRDRAPSTRAQVARLENPADWFYQERWLLAPLGETALPALRYPWLVFLDQTGLGERLVAKLRRQGYPVICVEAGTAFARLETEHFRLRAGESEDYVRLLQIIASEGLTPRRVLHCWSVSTGAQQSDAATLSAHIQNCFFSLVSLARALSEYTLDEPLALYVLSTNAQRVLEEDLVQPEHALAPGACLVIAQEPLNLACRCIDLDWEAGAANGWQDEVFVDSLLRECTGLDEELQIAYRQGQRWARTYVQQPLTESSAQPVVLREQGVYLLTGGLGAIGLTLAEDLATHYQARLVLLTRQSFPQRAEWEDWLAEHEGQEADQATSQVVRRLQEIEARGGTVLVVQGDVGVTEQIQLAIEQTITTFGALHGVFHLAGVIDERYSRSVQDITFADCNVHFQAKSIGTAVLGDVLARRELPLDFVLCFSSLSATLGGLGFVAYTAANRYLGAYAHRANRQGLGRWLSIDWDTWQVRELTHEGLGETIAAFTMTPQEGLEALRRALASGESHLIQSTGDLFARLQQWVRTDVLHEHHVGIRQGRQIRQTVVTASVSLSRAEVEQCIRRTWQEVLGLEEIGEHEPFFEIGGNSLLALTVISKLKKALRCPVPAVALFEAPTVKQLAAYLAPLAPALSDVNQQEHLRTRRTQARQQAGTGALAIVAMTGRFPGAVSVEQFWQNLRAGRESISFFTPQELEAAGIDPAVFQLPNYVPARPILPAEEVEGFDAALFGYSPREAELTDPQHRLFLECCWEALERAGYNPQEYTGLIGLFAGTNLSTYLLSAEPEQLVGTNDYQLLAGNDKDSLTSTVSYKLNLRGPAVAVQTFCSTSLVAVHLACQSLRRGECDLALAGGISIRVPSVGGHLYEPGGMESPDGHCRTFDAQAGGSMFGDGVGVVVLKRLHEAIEDGDQVLAVIRGSAINNDGAGKVSYTAPSVTGQSQVVLDALEDAGVSAESISYVEAHGTATKLGDPIEVAALTKAYRSQTEAVGYCAIGSVKTNVGHLDRAAGVSGLIKTVQALQAEALPASLHYERPNPEIDFASSPFVVNAALRAWPRQQGNPRRAGINSLGMGGTNVHVIVEEAPPREASGASREWQLLLLSAKTTTALEQARGNLAAHLRAHEELSLTDVAYTLQQGRKRLEQRAALVCRNRGEALALLEGDGALLMRRQEQRTERPVAFLFPGMGEQYVGMAQQLYAREAVFQEQLDRCCHLLEPHLGLDLRTQLFPDHAEVTQAHSQKKVGTLGRTELGQPALFVVSYALAQLLMSWGISPQALLGYSVGEYVAACLSGVLSLEDTLTLVAWRARWISEGPRGALLAVALGEEAIAPYLEDGVSVAISVNPISCVLGGSVEAVARVQQKLQRAEIAYRQVESHHAFHTAQLSVLQEHVVELTRTLKRRAPGIPYISNVTGTWITAEQATDENYWARHMCEPVRFSQGVETLLELEEYVVVEIGPGQSLSSFVRQHPKCSREQMALVMASLPAAHEQQEEQEYLVRLLGKLWLCGAQINWEGYAAREQRQRVLLPTYPFEHQRYWLEPRKQNHVQSVAQRQIESDIPRMADLSDWFYGLSWRQALRIKRHGAGSTLVGKQEQWLVLAEAAGIGLQIAAQLRSIGERVIVVLPGNDFASLGEETYTVRPAERVDYDALLNDLRLQQRLPAHIAHLWLTTPQGNQERESAADEALLQDSFYSLLALTQALGDLALERCEIAIISSEMHAVLGNESICPAKATSLGFCRVIPQEYANLSCRNIDIILPARGSKQKNVLVQQILRELLADAGEAVVALRGGSRWVQAFEPLPMRKEEYPDLPWRTRGVYLLTGGLGGIALAVADLLARTVQARLVLLNRSGLPPRAEWEQIIQQEPESIQAESIRKAVALETSGAEVLVLQADVADEQQMRAAYQQIQERFGELHGVFHLAGVPGVGLTQLKRREQAAGVLAPKVQGTLILQRMLKDQPLDFLVLFSSVTSITGGGPGQVDYSAANAFLDAVAQREQQMGRRVLAIDWGEWQWNAWEDGLSGYGIEAQRYLREHRQRFGIALEEGTEALQRILSSDVGHVVVSTQDFRLIAEQSRSFTAAVVLQKTREQRRTLYARPDLVSSYVAPRSPLEQQIAALWEDLLGVTPIGINDNFFELGGNSLLGIDLIARLRKMHQSEKLAAYVLYEAPTVSMLARYLEPDATEAIASAVDERLERGKWRRESLKQLKHGTKRTRV